LRAFSETETAKIAKPAIAETEIDAKTKTKARVICSPDGERRQIVNEIERGGRKIGRDVVLNHCGSEKLAGQPAE
jgi:hypothetical protein